MKHLVLAGAGHAHLTALANLEEYRRQGHRVILVSPDAYHYYSGMGAGMLGGIYRPGEVRFHVRKLAEGGGATFLKDRVVRVSAGEKVLILESGARLAYDVVSFNVGSYVPTDIVGGSRENVFTVKPIAGLLLAQKAVREKIRDGVPKLVVVGGGPAGLELAGNLFRLVSECGGQAHITLVAGTGLLPSFPDKARLLALSSLRRRHVEILEHTTVTHIGNGAAHVENGDRIAYDIIFLASGVKPDPVFRDSGLPVGPDGGLLVNDYLQSVAFPEMFGGGDCISLQGQVLDHVGVHAVRQNRPLYRNTLAALGDGTMERFVPQKKYLLIFNLGDGTGIFVRKTWVWQGKFAWVLKDWIDRRFMRKFQISGERDDDGAAID